MKNKCVYLHKTINNEVFYVGSGNLSRAYLKELSELTGSASGRGRRYSEYVKSIDFNYIVEIVAENLDSNQAIEIEQTIFDKYSNTLVNTRRPSKVKELPGKEYLCEIFEISQNSPSGLVWKRKSKRCKVGSCAGTKKKNGYYIVHVDDALFAVHRVILTMLGADITNKIVDHIDGNPSNNSVENLRPVTHYENSQNVRRNFTNAAEFIGVHFSNERWVARATINGKVLSKSYTVNMYGYETAMKLAIQKRQEFNEIKARE